MTAQESKLQQQKQTPIRGTTSLTTSSSPLIIMNAEHSHGSEPTSPMSPTSPTSPVLPVSPLSPTQPIELCENFYVDSKRKQNVLIQVQLSAAGVYLQRKDSERSKSPIAAQLIPMNDIIGTHCGPRQKKRARGGLNSCKRVTHDEESQNNEENVDAKSPKKDTSAYLYIYAYVKKEKPLRRVQTVRILRFRNHNDYNENLKCAEQWHEGIRRHKRNTSKYNSDDGKQLLILLNPKSGSGKGRELFQKQVAPLLREAQIPYELHVTTYQSFALEFVRTHRQLLERYRGIVVASGDGLFFEVLNGLMMRIDWNRVCRELPLGIIPCGSGNGLAKSIAHHCNEPYAPKPILHATLMCVSGQSTPMDVVRVELGNQGKQSVLYSFLSIGWGLIADIDIESERLRSIGAQRFNIWAVKRLITLRTYSGRLYYLPVSPTDKQTVTTKTNTNELPNGNAHGQPPSPAPVATVNTPVQTTNDLERPNTSGTSNAEFKDLSDDSEVDLEVYADNDKFTDALSMNSSQYKYEKDSWHSTASRTTAYFSVAGNSLHSSRRSRNADMSQRIDAVNSQFKKSMPKGTIPAINEPLSKADGWIHEEGDFVMVHAAYTTHLAADCFFAPDSTLNDGIIYLVVIRGGVGRSQLINFLLNLNTGTHFPTQPDPYIQVIPVRAFRIEPTCPNGILAIDGERVEYVPLQAEILPGLINVMTSNGP